MENVKQIKLKARDMFDERFGENDKVFAKTDENGLLFSMTKKDLKSFIDQIIDLAIAERDREIVDMIKEVTGEMRTSETDKIINLITNSKK